MFSFEDEANGLNINRAFAFTNAVSGSPVASTHFLLQNGLYSFWAECACVVFMTDAATDPPAVPTAQVLSPLFYPGALVGAGQLLQFQMDSTTTTSFGSGTITPTGIRVFQLTAVAGNFFITRFRRGTT